MMFKASRNNKILIPLAAVVILVSFVAAFNEAQAINTLRTKKFRMPGRHEFFLRHGDYIVWILNKWKPSGIDEKPNTPELRLSDSSGEEVKCETVRDHFSQRNNEKEGWQECTAQIRIDGIYQLQASSPVMKSFVVAVVPRESNFWDLGSSMSFVGINNDHFEPTITSQLERFLFQSKSQYFPAAP